MKEAAAIGDFIDHYDHHRYHESLGNHAPADAILRRAETILNRRKPIKAKTIETCRLLHRKTAAQAETPTSQALRSRSGPRVPNHLTTDKHTLVATSLG